MRFGSLLKAFGLLSIFFVIPMGIAAQQPKDSQVIIIDVAEAETTPAIVQHLPDWKNAQNRAAYIKNTGELRKLLGERPIFDLINLDGGTEAVTAPYEAGKLLIVEYPTPQASVDADNKINQMLAESPPNPPVFYRRVGNYSVFVFDASDEAAANALIDEVKYQKTVQWLGEDPFLLERAERAYLNTTSQMFISSMIAIVLGFALATLSGIAVGFFVFYLRKQKRASMTAFSDAGGMVRLNLDGLSAEIAPDRLLKG